MSNKYSVSWDNGDTLLTSRLSEDGRAMELSELVYYNHKLLAVDDRTGVIMAIENGKAVPQYILMDGNGKTNKGFKSEWATVKDGLLCIL
jgi:soluble calcium-activated nucleotidase 1